ncbi:alpha/beta-hydrolase [Aaosphaeria arxii CBS 175.79]|uniref:Alpha/beta-hydrolase n=1 Tax=Aaosphaeria arxii CBS 175.79 TaxID=1450172 RepID=A0A6A5XHH3_9PLEO|nr:alpha/beta-hydrolase [Aaosphaeria arxii CBS 175.79]KAF2011764.1 alpha/beta-hydrolase [Aaosphaeria arxii CBS 175.79]
MRPFQSPHVLLIAAVLWVLPTAVFATSWKPTIILVPGSFHRSIVYNEVVSGLRRAQFNRIYPIDLPSNGNDIHDREPDINAVRKPLERALAAGQDVVLVGNSYGATVIGDALKDFKSDAVSATRDSKQTRGRGKVLGVVMVSSPCSSTSLFVWKKHIIPNANRLAIQLAGFIPYISEVEHPETKLDARTVAPPLFRFDNNSRVWSDGDPNLSAAQAFYNLLPPHESQYWASKLTFASFNAMNATARYIPYTGDFNCLYVVGLQDKSIPVAWAQTFFGQPGARFQVINLDADHVMMLSKPTEVVNIIRQVAGS